MKKHDYKLLSSLYYDFKDEYQKLYESRVQAENCVLLDFKIGNNQAFFMETPELLKICVEIARLDKEIAELQHALPEIAKQQYANKCLIDEVVITNKIEGVNSTRKEISEILERLKPSISNRFNGMVDGYLSTDKTPPSFIGSCEDVRRLYDAVLLDVVLDEDPNDRPDGELFRKEAVSVVNSRQQVVHEGLMPESKIIDAMEKAIRILNDESIEMLFRIAAFHCLFGYIHPFYNGNGRLDRFISSWYLSQVVEPAVGYRLSYTIRENLGDYYKSFGITQNPINKGDITPFIYYYMDVIKESAVNLRDGLRERKARYESLLVELNLLPYGDDYKYVDLYCILLQAELFSEYGVSINTLVEKCEISKPTLANRLAQIDKHGLLKTTTMYKNKFYRLNVDKMEEYLRLCGDFDYREDLNMILDERYT